MTPFQCENCHFQNIMRRNPHPHNLQDEEILELIRRASLDAFWSRATGTVESNLRRARRLEQRAKEKGRPPINDNMGPWPIEDAMGMNSAISILEESLNPGKHEEFVQWGTFRKTRATISNIGQAGVGGLQDSIASYEMKKLWISSVVTHSFWFSRFMEGIHKRVGEHVKQDEPITIDVLHALEAILERDWKTSSSPKESRRIAEMGAWFIAGFVAGLRGEEMLLIERAGTTNSLKTLKGEGWFKLVISGATKGNRLSGAKFELPLVGITQGTGLQPGKWVSRLCYLHKQEKEGKRTRLFSRVLSPSKLIEFQDDFFSYLEQVQNETNFIDSEVTVRDDFGILRSTRRGVTAHAQNMGIPENVIKSFNRWRSDMKSSSNIGASLDMLARYTKIETILPVLLSFSRAQ